MKTKQKKYWWIDMLLFIGFLLAFFLSFTGVELHQWLGIFGGLLALYHLLLHSDWVDAVSKRLFSNVSTNVLIKYILDGMILAGFFFIIFTGLIISTWLNFSLNNYDSWLSIHIIASISTLLALLVKLATHWRWISRTTKSVILPPASNTAQAPQLKPALVEKTAVDRRDFLKVMGVVGGASLIALLSATKSLAALQAKATARSAQSSTEDLNGRYSGQSGLSSPLGQSGGSGGSCSVQCGRRCSYPGGCRRYRDADGDNLCDFGECA